MFVPVSIMEENLDPLVVVLLGRVNHGAAVYSSTSLDTPTKQDTKVYLSPSL